MLTLTFHERRARHSKAEHSTCEWREHPRNGPFTESGGKETAPPSVITCSAGQEPHREANGAGKLQLRVKGRLGSLV